MKKLLLLLSLTWITSLNIWSQTSLLSSAFTMGMDMKKAESELRALKPSLTSDVIKTSSGHVIFAQNLEVDELPVQTILLVFIKKKLVYIQLNYPGNNGLKISREKLMKNDAVSPMTEQADVGVNSMSIYTSDNNTFMYTVVHMAKDNKSNPSGTDMFFTQEGFFNEMAKAAQILTEMQQKLLSGK